MPQRSTELAVMDSTSTLEPTNANTNSEQQSSQSTQFSQTTDHSDWEEENALPKDIFNSAMKTMSRNFPTLSSQLNIPWSSLSKSSKSYYLKIISEALQLVLQYVTPGQEERVLVDVCKKMQPVISKENELDSMSEALIKAYQNQDDRLSQLQILSLFANKFTKERLMELIPGLTIYKIDSARRHANVTSPGQMLNPPKIYRSRLTMAKVMHFIEFISSPIYHQAVGYGSKKLTLSSGLEIEIPKIVRNVIASRLITLYHQFCKEEEYDSLCRASLFSIIKVCAASQKKNMHGLDNITSDGMRAIEVLLKVVSRLEMLGVTSATANRIKSLIGHVNQHLKFEMKGHVENESVCIEHCSIYSLSDTTCNFLRQECNHNHNKSCDDCSITNALDSAISNAVSSVQLAIPSDVQQEINHDVQISTSNILNWKAHCIRTVHQEQARRTVISNLKSNQCLIIMDWAMKFLPIKHRETQSDFFGKKGISWHISSVITPNQDLDPSDTHGSKDKKYEVLTFVHILQLGTQGWFSVAHILADVFTQLATVSSVKEVYLKSDNAGCYHCTPLITYIQHYNTSTETPVKVLEYNFSEAQSGKDICDAKTAHCKMHILRYCGEGHDILTPQHMREALMANGGVKGVIASVISVDKQHEKKTSTKISNISQLNNFSFSESGVICRRAYGIGSGIFLPTTQFKDGPTMTSLTGFKVDEPFPNLLPNKGMIKIICESEPVQEENPRNLEQNEGEQLQTENLPVVNNDQLFSCPDQSCTKVYTKVRFLENHLCIGNHSYIKNENQLDAVKRMWASQCYAVEREHKVIVRETVPLTESAVLKEGWALKLNKPAKRFSSTVKNYILTIFQYFETTGKRPNYDEIAEELKTKRDENGNKMFKSDEWLSPSQIRSLFSNLVKKNTSTSTQAITELTIRDTKADEDLQQAIADIDTLEYHNDMIEVATSSNVEFS